MSILICGYGEHGKDEVASRLAHKLGLTFTSSSKFIGEKVVFPLLADSEEYLDFDECYADRRNHRAVWFEAICDYNSVEPDKLTKDIIAEYDIYVGMRNPLEFEGSKHHFTHLIWVDASKRKPNEDAASNGLYPESFDYILDNNGPLGELDNEIDKLILWLEKG